jgi:DNA-binding NarL/FixJ family response regulator
MKSFDSTQTGCALSILVIDNSPIVRAGVRTMLTLNAKEDSITFTDAEDEPEALAKLAKSRYDIAIVDELVFEANEKFMQNVTALSSGLAVIVMGLFTNQYLAEKMLITGVRGCIPKSIGIRELRAAIRSIVDGEKYICSRVANHLLLSKKDGLPVCPNISKREKEILQLIIDEKTSPEIASQLFLSQRTVETHRKNLMLKLHVKKITGLVRAAYEYNLINPGSLL